MASIVSRFLLVLGLLVSVSTSAYLESQPQASNQFSSFANLGGSGGGNNNNGGFNGGFLGNGVSGGNGVRGGGDPIADLTESIPGGGFPGEDYPILASVPDTGFTCEGQLPGYYADTDDEAGCQVFHICQEGGRQDSFLCPNGTLFNQQYFVCDWWFNVDCSTAEQFFGLNAEIGTVHGDGISFNNAIGFGSASNLQNTFSAQSNGNYKNQGSASNLQNTFSAQSNGNYNNQGSASNPQNSFSAPGNGNGNGQGSASNLESLYTAPRNGNSNGLGSASHLQNSFSASRNGNSNGLGSSSNLQNSFSTSRNGNGNNRNRNRGHSNNVNGGNIQAPSHLYGSPN